MAQSLMVGTSLMMR